MKDLAELFELDPGVYDRKCLAEGADDPQKHCDGNVSARFEVGDRLPAAADTGRNPGLGDVTCLAFGAQFRAQIYRIQDQIHDVRYNEQIHQLQQ